MRTRMSGGVGAGGLITPGYPIGPFAPGERSGKGKLKTASNDTSHSKIFIDLFPPQSGTIELNLDLTKVRIRCISKAPISRCGKSKDSAIVQLQENTPTIHPGA